MGQVGINHFIQMIKSVPGMLGQMQQKIGGFILLNAGCELLMVLQPGEQPALLPITQRIQPSDEYPEVLGSLAGVTILTAWYQVSDLVAVAVQFTFLDEADEVIPGLSRLLAIDAANIVLIFLTESFQGF